MPTREFNFDGLVGPTHNYAGLGPGNLASQTHQHQASNPKAAALQGLAKMRLLHDLGVPQGVLPPPLRPDVRLLRRLGFCGDDAAVLAAARRDAPHLLAAAASASAMWAANAATVAPSADTADGKVHFTPANLTAALHRSIEAETTGATLRLIFPEGEHFAHHDPLPASVGFGDEGAANHTRFCAKYGEPGVQLFVYGDARQTAEDNTPCRFVARQAHAASTAVSRLHQLHPDRAVFAQQNPDAIDAGVFHNDVIAVGDRDTLLYHEHAFADESDTIERLRQAFGGVGDGQDLRLLRVSEGQLSLGDAVRTYLFNSQLVSNPNNERLLIVPTDCAQHAGVLAILNRWVETGDLDTWHAVDVRQSMSNGGGPACLRLRVVLTEAEQAAIRPGVVFTPTLHDRLRGWVEAHYRDRLQPADLADPALLDEARAAQRELGEILGLPLRV